MTNELSEIYDLHKFTHHAMATLFEFYIQNEDPDYAEQAAWAAFSEIDRLEDELSRYRPNSEISNINTLPAGQKLIITEDAFECIRMALELKALTSRAFDITYADQGENSDMPNLILDEEEMSVLRRSENTLIDLGGIGKGYAIEKAELILKDYGITSALIHGGFSSVKAIGAPEEFSGWAVTISNPFDSNEQILKLYLKDVSVSGSGIKKGGHIIDPSTGKAALSKFCAWAFSRSAIMSEGFSTAFMILDNAKVKEICEGNEELYGVVLDAGYSETKNYFSAGDSSLIKIIP